MILIYNTTMKGVPSPLEVTVGSYQLSGENDNPRNLLFPPLQR